MKKLLLAVLLGVAGTALAGEPVLINGAGATFPYPLYSKWFSEYNKLHPDERFNYQSIGSGGGIRQIVSGTVDFGASDAPMTDEELAKKPDLVHIPTVLGAVVVTWNLPGVTALKLTPEALAGIFLGQITKWNDPKIAQVNPGVALPDKAIAVVHRSDGSGTTAVFTDYLAKVSPQWKQKPGAGKSVRWPVGLGAKGNEGVTGMVKQMPGAIGYVELAYADQNKLPMAELRNQAGRFVKPSVESTTAAAADVQLPDDFRTSITNAAGEGAYPIASFTYLLVPKNFQNPVKGQSLVKFLWWATHDGQKFATPLDYAPLPKPVVEKVERKLKTLTVQGKPVALGSSK
ncbi:MAG: phosphate ABC transporter substrate-binding protein PstS [Myxococcaceae bacterium]|nr:phosphate ABC transporter substrate-binding protein PstS [Myxococcaceae bacterium]